MFGINFGAPDMPPSIRRKFRDSFVIECPACVGTGLDRGKTDGHGRCLQCRRGRVRVRLVGVAQSDIERNVMLHTVTRPGRVVHIEERQTAAGIWYGIYVY